MRPSVRRLKLSLFWTRRFSALLGTRLDPNAPMAFMARRGDYKRVFDELQRTPGSARPANGAPPVELPWPGSGTNRFWRGYVTPAQLSNVTGGVAWSRLVPLRRHAVEAPSLAPLDLDGAGARVDAEAFFHGHAAAFALHVTIAAERPLPLETLVDRCVAIRSGKVFSEEGRAPVRADELAAGRLETLCREALGSGPATEAGLAYSLVTVLQGDGVDPTKAVGADVHRALEGLTQWSPTWRTNPLPPLDANRIPTRTAPLGHLAYGRHQGRAVWEPSFFLPNQDGNASLSCYHRNLFAGMLQTDALVSFTKLADDAAAAGELSAAMNELSRPALEQLLAIHAGSRATGAYRSDSLRIQIDEHPWRASAASLAQRLESPASLPPPRLRP